MINFPDSCIIEALKTHAAKSNFHKFVADQYEARKDDKTLFILTNRFFSLHEKYHKAQSDDQRVLLEEAAIGVLFTIISILHDGKWIDPSDVTILKRLLGYLPITLTINY